MYGEKSLHGKDLVMLLYQMMLGMGMIVVQSQFNALVVEVKDCLFQG